MPPGARNPGLEASNFILGDGSDCFAPTRAEVRKIDADVRKCLPPGAAEAVLGSAYNDHAHIASKDGNLYIVHSLDKAAGSAGPEMWPHAIGKCAGDLYLTNDDRVHMQMINGVPKLRFFKAGYKCDVCGEQGKHGEYRWMCRAPSCVVCVDCFAGSKFTQALRAWKM
jgi:hypothetical protein